MENGSSQQSSKNTPLKQQSLRALLHLHMAVTKAIFEKWRIKTPYLYMDLNAGEGIDPKTGNDGSPLVFRSVVSEVIIPYQALFYEINPSQAEALRIRLAPQRPHEIVLCEDNANLVNRLPAYVRKGQYGLFYLDPNTPHLPIAALNRANHIYPRVDVAFNLACASKKRMIDLEWYTNLDQDIKAIGKEKWLVRKPIDKFQWSILLGTNWAGYPEYAAAGFYDIKGEIGRDIFEKLVYTKEELRDAHQPPLFDL